MGKTAQFGETYRMQAKNEPPPDLCEVCGGELDIDPESGEGHCPVCENPEE